VEVAENDFMTDKMDLFERTPVFSLIVEKPKTKSESYYIYVADDD
jgi:hypothetical protein